MGASASFRGAPDTLPDPQPNGRIEKSVSLRAEAKVKDLIVVFMIVIIFLISLE